MKTYLLSSLFILGLTAGASTHAMAQNVNMVMPGDDAQSRQEQAEPSVSDPMNYFAVSAGERQRMEEEKATMPEGKVPASELQYLPEELEVRGKGTLKIEDGRIVSGHQPAGTYNHCEAYKANGQPVPDGCIQKLGAEKTGQPAPARNASPAAPTTPIASEQPKTLNQQLQAKGGAAPAAMATQAAAPAPQAEPQTAQPTAASGAKAGSLIENTAVVDKARGSKTNIISNTDTGVVLSE